MGSNASRASLSTPAPELLARTPGRPNDRSGVKSRLESEKGGTVRWPNQRSFPSYAMPVAWKEVMIFDLTSVKTPSIIHPMWRRSLALSVAVLLLMTPACGSDNSSANPGGGAGSAGSGIAGNGGSPNNTAGMAGDHRDDAGASNVGGAQSPRPDNAGGAGARTTIDAAFPLPAVDPNKDLRELSDTERAALCDWLAAEWGGYGLETQCGPTSSAKVYDNQTVCVSRAFSGHCAATVTDWEACIAASAPSHSCIMSDLCWKPLDC